MKHCRVVFEPDGAGVWVHRGATILEAAERAGLILNTVCGGQGTCGKCAVRLGPAGNEVLACQWHVQDNISVYVPTTSRFFEQKILERGIDRQVKVNPCIFKKYINIDTAKTPAVQKALSKVCAGEIFEITNEAAEQLQRLRDSGQRAGVTAVGYSCPGSEKSSSQTAAWRIISFEPGDTTEVLFGVATDIGTTTVVSKLIDLRNGHCLATAADVNPQTIYGDDVISRIAYAENEEKLYKLQQAIITCLNEQIGRLVKQALRHCSGQADIEAKHIYEIVVAGNTTMNHIFLGFPVSQLGRAPYSAFSVEAVDRPAKDMHLAINPAGNVHTIENIAGFVGSDTTSVAVAVGIDQSEQETLVVDIGTNGEIILAGKGELYTASCAAGPALEGARVSQGSRAIPGAIETVLIEGDDLDLGVIGPGSARTICGSGLVDAVAALLDLGVLDSTGRFVQREQLEGKLPPAILSRIIEKDGASAFVLARNDNNENQPVVLTQKDIREVQLAKAAIRAGIKLLQQKLGVKDSQIKQVLLAGAFGNYIRRESALRIGLLPQVPAERIHFVGNAASSGAEMILLNRQCRTLASQLARKIKYLEIAHEPEFQSVFAEAMTF